VGGRRRGAKLGHHVQDLLIRGVEGAVRLLPEGFATALGGALGRVAGSGLRIRRRVVEANLRRAFPEAEDGWIRRTAAASYAHLGREGIALLRLGALGPREVWERTEVEGIEHLREPLSHGRGVVLLTGHLGNWEIGGAAMAVREIPIDVVARRQNNPLFNARVNRTRERLGMQVVDRDGGTKRILRALSGGRAVALVADQNVRTGGLFVPFFGTDASTARGPALLALRTGAAVVFATALRLPGLRARYRIRLRPLDPPAPGEEGARAFLAHYLSTLEAAIREAPEQYLWAHKRWKTRPTPEGGAEEPDPGAAVPQDSSGNPGAPRTSGSEGARRAAPPAPTDPSASHERSSRDPSNGEPR
jgi:Kdo2-lipid IVA lauroyltransferase/acyltransferase